MTRGAISIALAGLVIAASGGSAGAQTIECTITGTAGKTVLSEQPGTM